MEEERSAGAAPSAAAAVAIARSPRAQLPRSVVHLSKKQRRLEKSKTFLNSNLCNALLVYWWWVRAQLASLCLILHNYLHNSLCVELQAQGALGAKEEKRLKLKESMADFGSLMESLRESLWDESRRLDSVARSAGPMAPRVSGKVLEKEIHQFKAVASHPAFTANPSAALLQHLSNKVQLEIANGAKVVSQRRRVQKLTAKMNNK